MRIVTVEENSSHQPPNKNITFIRKPKIEKLYVYNRMLFKRSETKMVSLSWRYIMSKLLNDVRSMMEEHKSSETIVFAINNSTEEKEIRNKYKVTDKSNDAQGKYLIISNIVNVIETLEKDGWEYKHEFKLTTSDMNTLVQFTALVKGNEYRKIENGKVYSPEKIMSDMDYENMGE